MNETPQARTKAPSDLAQHPLPPIMSVERAASQLQVHTATLLALTCPWNAASKETHHRRWAQARLQADELWAAFRPLHANLASLPPRRQYLVRAMKPLVQALVMRAGFAFQLLEERESDLPSSPYSAVIRESHDCSIGLRNLARAFGEDPVSTATTPASFSGIPAEVVPV